MTSYSLMNLYNHCSHLWRPCLGGSHILILGSGNLGESVFSHDAKALELSPQVESFGCHFWPESEDFFHHLAIPQ